MKGEFIKTKTKQPTGFTNKQKNTLSKPNVNGKYLLLRTRTLWKINMPRINKQTNNTFETACSKSQANNYVHTSCVASITVSLLSLSVNLLEGSYPERSATLVVWVSSNQKCRNMWAAHGGAKYQHILAQCHIHI